jgi:hypothetical protein
LVIIFLFFLFWVLSLSLCKECVFMCVIKPK